MDVASLADLLHETAEHHDRGAQRLDALDDVGDEVVVAHLDPPERARSRTREAKVAACGVGHPRVPGRAVLRIDAG